MEYKYLYVKGGGKKKFNISLIIAVISFLIGIYMLTPINATTSAQSELTTWFADEIFVSR